MENLSFVELEAVNGGLTGGDIAWGALTGAASGALEMSAAGPGGAVAGAIIGSASGAIGAIGVSGIRHAIGWD
ncbi:TPA: Blp family class II bacteriocin [Clostridium perfringens]|nr:Blp family class II bacteriocin [Clostridium perfringens]HBI7169028.1 Blp family class II bacteriocin [Clostridium perfringens]